MRKRIITHSRGAQFRDGKSSFLFVGFLFLLLGEVALLLDNHDVAAQIFGFFLLMLLLYILDFRGVQINKSRSLVREYRINVWGRTGKWIDLSQFKFVSFEYEQYGIEQHDYSEGYYGVTKPVRQGQFFVSLFDPKSGKDIVLNEIYSYKEAKEFALHTAKELNLPMNSTFEQKLKEVRQRRGN